MKPALLVLLPALACAAPPFEPTLESLTRRDPAPEWFRDAKVGIYFHWGVYSVPAFGNEWYPCNMFAKGSRENRHHIATWGDPAESPAPLSLQLFEAGFDFSDFLFDGFCFFAQRLPRLGPRAALGFSVVF